MKKVLLSLLPVLLLGCDGSGPQQSSPPPVIPAIQSAESRVPLLTPDQQEGNVVFDITLHEVKDIELLFARLEKLVTEPHAQGELPRIALVLHGPEVEFFALKNYPRYQDLVDLAAKLTAFEIIEIKACQTRMQSLGLSGSDMPAFIDLVPFGPDEVERLVEESYVRM